MIPFGAHDACSLTVSMLRLRRVLGRRRDRWQRVARLLSLPSLALSNALAAAAPDAPRTGALRVARRTHARSSRSWWPSTASTRSELAACSRRCAICRESSRRCRARSLAPPKWYDYAPQFLNPERIEGGRRVLAAQRRRRLRAPRREYSIPAEVIVAIIGVETFYGRNMGVFRVFDALTTLAFDYPRRADFFASELKQFLRSRAIKASRRWCQGVVRGRARACRNSCRAAIATYAVDYDGDGRIDLSADPADAIGSVANFLARHDWQPGRRCCCQARVDRGGRAKRVLRTPRRRHQRAAAARRLDARRRRRLRRAGRSRRRSRRRC